MQVNEIKPEYIFSSLIFFADAFKKAFFTLKNKSQPPRRRSDIQHQGRHLNILCAFKFIFVSRENSIEL